MTDRVALAARLNGDCHSATIDRAALDDVLRSQGEDFFRHVTEHCPHLFAAVPLFVSAAQIEQMRAVIAAVEGVVNLPAWGAEVFLPSPSGGGVRGEGISSGENFALSIALSRRERRLKQPSAKGVFFGYDFHLNTEGAHLIEINANAGGALLNALLLQSQRNVMMPGEVAALDNLEQVFLEMFRNEWRLERGDAPLQIIAIVDEQPEKQYLYPEFVLAQRMFERAGIIALIADPSELESRADGLYYRKHKVNLVYNRLTDFFLQRHAALNAAYRSNQVVLTPHPRAYAQYADKRNLARLTDADDLRALGVNEADIATLQAGIPHTIVVQSRHGGAQHSGAGGTASQLLPQSAGRDPHPNPLPEGEGTVALSPSGGKLDRGLASNVSQLQPDMEAALWAERKQWFFKPAWGFGSRGTYRGANVTKRAFTEIMQGGYVAQRMALPGERIMCVEGAEPVPLKSDVRCYVYKGQMQLVAARLYQGQTTNFRTEGGGFAPVRIVG